MYGLWNLWQPQADSLIDSELSDELTKLNNYLGYLSDFLGHWNTEAKSEISEEKLKILRQIIYKDINKLTSNILEASGSFYSKSIYNESYKPSTINREEFKLPEDFQNLTLFSEREMIVKLIEEKGSFNDIEDENS